MSSHSLDENGVQRPVNHVTPSNRSDVSATNPHLLIVLMNEDLSDELHKVYIPRTREMPDAVVYQGDYYEVVNTRLELPEYRQCMVATAYDKS